MLKKIVAILLTALMLCGMFTLAGCQQNNSKNAFVVPEEKVLAMSRIYILPIFECKLNGRKRRMTMSVILYSILLQKSVYLINPGFHLIILTN